MPIRVARFQWVAICIVVAGLLFSTLALSGDALHRCVRVAVTHLQHNHGIAQQTQSAPHPRFLHSGCSPPSAPLPQCGALLCCCTVALLHCCHNVVCCLQLTV